MSKRNSRHIGSSLIATIAASAAFFAWIGVAEAGSCSVSGPNACVFTPGLFTGNVSQNPTGSLNYIIPSISNLGTFTTSPIAFEWGYSVGDNPTPQDAGSIQAFVAAWTGLPVGSVIDANDQSGTTSTFGGSGFSTTTLADAYAVHYGNGELLFLFQTPTAFSFSNWSLGNLSNFRSYDVTWPGPGPGPGPSQTPIPGALWLFGTVLAGGAGLGRWRNKRRKAVALAA